MKTTFEPTSKKFWRVSFMIALTGFLLMPGSKSAEAACANPAGVGGEQIYNSTHNLMQFCDGTDWTAMKGDGDTLSSLSCSDGQIAEWDNTGSAWICAAAASGADNLGDHTATQALAMATFKITGLGTPTAAADATTKLYVDTAAAAAADNLGNHQVGQNLDLNTFKLVGNNGTTGIAIDASGNVTVDGTVDLGTDKIVNLADPTTDQDAATKKYVDDNEADTLADLACTDGQIAKWNNGGSVWACAADVGGGAGDDLGNHTATTALAMATNKITGLGDPTLAQDAATKAYVDAQVSSGGADDLGDHTATQALDLATFKLVGNGGTTGIAIDATGNVTVDGTIDLGTDKIINLGTPTASADAATKGYVDTSVAAAADNLGNHEAGQSIDLNTFKLVGNNGTTGIAIDATGNVTVDGTIDLGTDKIVNLADPTLAQDAATKAYVDAQVSSGGADDLGDHTATQALNLDSNNITNAGTITSAGQMTMTNSANTNPDIQFAGSGIISSETGVAIHIDSDNNSTADDFIIKKNSPTSTGAVQIFRIEESGDVIVQGQISNVTDPTNAQDAATKAYVDAQVSSGGADDLGDHTATQNLVIGNNTITSATSIGVKPDVHFDASGLIAADDSVLISLDGDNDTTTAGFVIRKDALTNAGTKVFEVSEDGTVEVQGKIINVTDPTLAQDAATKAYVDAQVLAGGADNLGDHTATQALNLDSNNITNAGTITSTGQMTLTNTAASNPDVQFSNSGLIAAENYIYLNIDSDNSSTNASIIVRKDGNTNAAAEVFKIEESGLVTVQGKIANVTDPTAAQDAATKAYVDAQVLAGGADDLGDHTATQALAMATYKITGLGTPTATTDAATKAYVDSKADTLSSLSCTDGQVASWNNGGSVWICSNNGSGAGDDLGNHTATTALAMATNKITGLGTPTASADAATKGYVDTSVAAAADNLGNHTATQALKVGAQQIQLGTANLQTLAGANNQYLHYDANHSTATGIRLRDLENVTYGTVYGSGDGTYFGLMDGDNQWSYLALKDTRTDFRINNINEMRLYPTYLSLESNLISNVSDPVGAQDAATKSYVDAQVSSGGADDLGDHTATQNIILGSNYLSGDGDNEGLRINNNGNIGIGTASPTFPIHVVSSQGTAATTVFERENNTDDRSDIAFKSNGVVSDANPQWNVGIFENDYDWAVRRWNGTLATRIIGISASDGYVGIRNADPKSPLHISGSVQIAADGSTCNADKAGAIRYSGTNISYCNATAWQTLGTTTSGDNLGSGGTTTGTLYTSNGNIGLDSSDRISYLDNVATLFYVNNVQEMRLTSAGLDLNSNLIYDLADPTAAQHAATKAYVDAQVSSGGADDLGDHTATQALAMANFKITGLGTPTASADATTKAYVDTSVAAAADNLGNHTATQALAMGTNNITGTGTVTAGSLIATSTAGLVWENGISAITHNDGGGNSQIRFGHDYTSSDERFTQNGGAVVITSNIDATSGTALTTKVASNPGAGDNTAIVWGSSLIQTATDITFGGTSLLTGTGDDLGAGGSGDLITDDTIDSSEIEDNTIAAVDIAANAVGASEIAASAVRASEIQDGSIVATTELSATGTKNATTYLRGDNTWATVPSGADNLGNHTATQALAMANFKITGLGTPTASADAATKAYVDALVPATATDADTVDSLHAASFIRSDANDDVTAHTEWQDNMEIRLGSGADFRMDFTGTDTIMRSYSHGSRWILQGEDVGGTNRNLMRADPDGAATLYYAGSSKLVTASNGVAITGKVTGLTDPTAAQDAATKAYVDAQVLSGGADNLGNHTATTALAMATNKITGLGTPTVATDAATKAYVDTAAAAAADNLGAGGTTAGDVYATGQDIGRDSGDRLTFINNARIEFDVNAVEEMRLTPTMLDLNGNKIFDVGGADATLLNGSGYLTLGAESGTNIVFDNNEIQARNNAATSTLILNQDGGNVHIGKDGVSSGNLDMNEGRIYDLPTPTGASDAATKAYVDATVAAAPGDNLGAGGSGDLITDDTIDSSEIEDNTIAAVDIAAGAVDTSELAADAVVSSKIENNTITASDIGPDAVNASEIAASAVRASEIQDGSVVATTELSATGTKNSTTFLRGDNTWATVPSSADNLGSGGTTTGNLYTTNQHVGRDSGDRLSFINNARIEFDVNGVEEARLTPSTLDLNGNTLSDTTGVEIQHNTSAVGWAGYLQLYAPNSPAPADNSRFKMINYNNATANYLEFRAENDDGTAKHANMLTLNAGTGNVGIGTTNPLQKLHTTGAARADGGYQVDGRTMINASGNIHTARYTDDTRYGYFEGRNNSNARGFYLGYGNGGTQVNLALDAANRLEVTGGLIDMNTNKIVGLGTPTAGADATTKTYVDNAISSAPGDNLGAGGTTAGDVYATGQDIGRDSGDRLSFINNTRIEFDVNGVEKMRLLSNGLDMQANRIYDLGAPTSANDATTKAYVDALVPASATNADTVDGLHAASFLRSNADDSTTGNIGFTSGNGKGLKFWNSDSYKIYMSSQGDATWGGRMDATSDYNMYFRMTGGTNRGFVFQNATTELAQIDATGRVYASSFSGNGASLTALNASQLTSGTLPNARIGANSIGADKLAANSVNVSEIAASAVRASEIQDGSVVATTELSATGTKNSTTFLRGDNTWAAPPSGADNLGAGGTTAGNVYATGQNIGRDSGDRLTFVNNSRIEFDVNGIEEMRLTAGGLDINGNDLTEVKNLYANGSFYYGDLKEIIDFSDAWLRLNQNGDFTSGVYTPGLIRADNGFQVDATTIINGSGTVIGGQVGSGINASNITTGTLPNARLGASSIGLGKLSATGTSNNTTYLRGDNTWSTVNAQTVDGLDSTAFIRANANDNVSGHTEWQDGFEARFGNDADFRVEHDGSNHIIRGYKHGTPIYVQAENAGGTNRTMIFADPDNSVRLYYTGSEKARTTTTGMRFIPIAGNAPTR